MCSGEATEPDRVTTPAVVLTEMFSAERSRLASSLALMAAVMRASAVASAMRVAGLARLAADDLAGAGQFVLDVLGAQVEHAQFILSGVTGGLGGALDLLPGGPQAGIVPVSDVEPDRRAADARCPRPAPGRFSCAERVTRYAES